MAVVKQLRKKIDIYKGENSELEMAIGPCYFLVPKYVEVLIPRTSEYDLFGNKIIADNQGKVMSLWWPYSNMTGIPIKRGHFDTAVHTEGRPWAD